MATVTYIYIYIYPPAHICTIHIPVCPSLSSPYVKLAMSDLVAAMVLLPRVAPPLLLVSVKALLSKRVVTISGWPLHVASLRAKHVELQRDGSRVVTGARTKAGATRPTHHTMRQILTWTEHV